MALFLFDLYLIKTSPESTDQKTQRNTFDGHIFSQQHPMHENQIVPKTWTIQWHRFALSRSNGNSNWKSHQSNSTTMTTKQKRKKKMSGNATFITQSPPNTHPTIATTQQTKTTQQNNKKSQTASTRLNFIGKLNSVRNSVKSPDNEIRDNDLTLIHQYNNKKQHQQYHEKQVQLQSIWMQFLNLLFIFQILELRQHFDICATMHVLWPYDNIIHCKFTEC